MFFTLTGTSKRVEDRDAFLMPLLEIAFHVFDTAALIFVGRRHI